MAMCVCILLQNALLNWNCNDKINITVIIIHKKNKKFGEQVFASDDYIFIWVVTDTRVLFVVHVSMASSGPGLTEQVSGLIGQVSLLVELPRLLSSTSLLKLIDNLAALVTAWAKYI